MKRIVVIALLLTFIIGATGYARDNYSEKERKEFAKDAEKEAKRRAKELKKQKFQQAGAMSLETLLKQTLVKTKDFGGKCVIKEINVTNAKTLSLAEKRLLTNAQAEYAKEVEAIIKGKTTTNDNQSDEEGVEFMNEASETVFKKELKGDVKLSFYVYKENNDGTFWVKGYCLIDEDDTRRTLQRVAEKVKDNLKLSEAISKALNDDIELKDDESED
ncbi:MAG: hypothetical protein ACI30K_08240 [Muribaculaceae bacterium]